MRRVEHAIRLTPAALARARRLLAGDSAARGLRFGVRRAGCSGYAYRLELARDVDEGDQVFEQDGLRIVVDAESLPLVRGTEIDLVAERFGERFVFRNPNVTAECGCGESFTTRTEHAG
ncbi:MAG: iron-sulfur cluster assembly accessory protein [Xanthomonadales bacterium]|nr:iron-sulfur cluster assembly accessory protein [Xanthomonadales bacterium]